MGPLQRANFRSRSCFSSDSYSYTSDSSDSSCFRTTTLLQHWGASLGVALIRNGSRCGYPPQLGLLSRNGCALVYCASATPCVRAWSARSARTGGVPFPRMRFYCSLRSRCSRVDRLCTRRCALQKSRTSFPRAGRCAYSSARSLLEAPRVAADEGRSERLTVNPSRAPRLRAGAPLPRSDSGLMRAWRRRVAESSPSAPRRGELAALPLTPGIGGTSSRCSR